MIDLLQLNELFSLTKEKLEETEETLEHTSKKLEDTKERLITTRVDRDEQKFLVSQHVKGEAKLHSQASQVLKENQLKYPFWKWRLKRGVFH